MQNDSRGFINESIFMEHRSGFSQQVPSLAWWTDKSSTLPLCWYFGLAEWYAQQAFPLINKDLKKYIKIILEHIITP